MAEAAQLDIDVPLVVMTYYNLVHHAGHVRFASMLADAGISGAIVPDLPLDELDGWGDAADAAGVETVLLAAPTTPDALEGDLRALPRLGVRRRADGRDRCTRASGVRRAEMGRRLKAVTDRPVLLGVGISNGAQAVEAAAAADGVIVGSALIARLLDGGGPDAASAFVAELRGALDA